MWTFLRLPATPIDAFDGTIGTTLLEYVADEGAIVDIGDTIARVATRFAEINVIASARMKLLKHSLPSKIVVPFNCPFAVAEVYDDDVAEEYTRASISAAFPRSTRDQDQLSLVKDMLSSMKSDSRDQFNDWVRRNYRRLPMLFSEEDIAAMLNHDLGLEHANKLLRLFGVVSK